jgi:ankyrin repeat protein
MKTRFCIKEYVRMLEDVSTVEAVQATRLILELGLLGERLGFCELQRLGGASQDTRLWAENGRILALKGMLDPTRPEQRLDTWMRAVRGADARIASEMLEVGGPAILHLVDPEGHSCLHVAAASGNLEVVRLLLRKCPGLLMSSPGIGRESCLYAAAENGHDHIVQELLKSTTDEERKKLLMLTNETGYSCLLAAVSGGHMHVVRRLLKAGGVDLLMLPDKWDGHCLPHAAALGHVTIVKTFIDFVHKTFPRDSQESRDVLDVRDTCQQSALEIAVRSGYMPIVDALLAAGAPSDHCLLMATSLEMVEKLLRRDEFKTRERLLQTTGLGKNCLHTAIDRNDTRIVNLLLKAADDQTQGDLLLQQTRYSGTCLHLAVRLQSESLVRALLQAALARDVPELLPLQNRQGNSCLHLAVNLQSVSLVGELLQAAGDFSTRPFDEMLTMQNTQGNSCLHLAVIAGRNHSCSSGDHINLYMVSMLLKGAVAMNVLPELLMLQNNNGDSCLHLAAEDGRFFVMKTLLEAGGRQLARLENINAQTWLHVLKDTIIASFGRSQSIL